MLQSDIARTKPTLALRDQVLNAVTDRIDDADIFISVAAVADYRVANAAEHKLKKDTGGIPPIELIENPDILAEVAARTDDRNLLQQMVNDARDAYSTGSTVIGWGAGHVLALAAWQRDDVHDAMRWLGGIPVDRGTASNLVAQVVELGLHEVGDLLVGGELVLVVLGAAAPDVAAVDNAGEGVVRPVLLRAGHDGDEVTQIAREGVEQPEGHRARLPARTPAP